MLAALGAGISDATKLFEVSKRILLMEFQCEFGEQATDDRKGKRTEPIDPYKECFGPQLAKTIRELWADEGQRVTSAAVTVGWAPGRSNPAASKQRDGKKQSQDHHHNQVCRP